MEVRAYHRRYEQNEFRLLNRFKRISYQKYGKKINTINNPKIISDHPMIIYQMSISIPFNK